MIYIAYPDIPAEAIVRTPSAAFDSDYGQGNLIYGERYLIGRKASTATSFRLLYDLGTVSGNTISKSANYLIIARADITLTAYATVTLKGHTANDYSAGTTVKSENLTSATLYGPDGHDYLTTFTASTAYRYWWLDFTTVSTPILYEHSKHYFGTYYSFGKGPASWEWSKVFEEGSREITTSGGASMMRVEEPRFRLSFEWQGISDTLTDDFLNKIAKRKDKHRFFLFTTDEHQILANKRIIHVQCLEAQATNPTRKSDWNTITATFEELIG